MSAGTDFAINNSAAWSGPIGETARRSIAGAGCAILGCSVLPVGKCAICPAHYCAVHSRNHRHVVRPVATAMDVGGLPLRSLLGYSGDWRRYTWRDHLSDWSKVAAAFVCLATLHWRRKRNKKTETWRGRTKTVYECAKHGLTVFPRRGGEP